MSVENLKKNLPEILSPIMMGGREVIPIIEGGKGIGVSNGITAGHFAKENAVGTFSGVIPKYYNEHGEYEPINYLGQTRKERHEELVQYSIKGAVSQAKRAFDIAGKAGRIHMNILWEMGGAKRILTEALEKAKGLIHGVTCGAGMPYQLSEIAEKYKVHYYPIVSSARAFKALWKRSYSKVADLLGGIVYECPWKAGGHNGLSNAEDPLKPESPYERVVEIRKFMNEVGLMEVPIILAGGVWHVNDFKEYLGNADIGKIAFQFGTRPILTKESPVSKEWMRKLLTLKEGDVFLNRFSPTGFYSSAVNNNFIQELKGRNDRQMPYSCEKTVEFSESFEYGSRGRTVFLKLDDAAKAKQYRAEGFDEILKTPDETIIFVSNGRKNKVTRDQINCVGCLSSCKFSNWAEHTQSNSTGVSPDPRSFCIQKTLIASLDTDDIENNLMFAGYNAFRLGQDKWYQGGNFIPTIKELVARIKTGY
jgi:NAD(P)H-dependent flavin oxidoreductase YrpB (nitropropane dioxygenase family)